MGIGVIVYGKSGSGKSHSLKNFDDDILYINVENKPLPFRKRFSKTYCVNTKKEVVAYIKAAAEKNIKTVIVDDCGYLMTEYFMKNHRGLKGNQVFDLYNEIAEIIFEVLITARDLPNDTIVYYVFHEDKNDYGDVAIKTLGKILDRHVSIEGIFTIVLRCMCVDKEHIFRTQTDGADITKTPEEMFDKYEIPNDLKYVDTKIREYYGLNGGTSK